MKLGMNLVYAAIVGLCGGILSGLFGVGGGIIMVPAMVKLLGLPIKTAVGTSLMVIPITALAGCYRHYLQGNVDWMVGVSLAPMAVIGAFGGAEIARHLSATHLRSLFGALMILVGLRMILAK